MINLRTESAKWTNGAVIDLGGELIAGEVKGIDKAVTLRNVRFAPGARLSGLRRVTIEDYKVEGTDAKIPAGGFLLGMTGCVGVTLRDGTVAGRSMTGRGLSLYKCEDVAIEGTDVSRTLQGVVVDLSQRVTIARTLLHYQRMDGFNLMRSSFVTIDGVTARDFETTPDQHPDLIQIINSATAPGICSDITIRGVRSRTVAQGITLFDHGRGGADRILVEDVEMLVGYYHGINLENVRGLTLRNVKVGALPGTDPKIKPWVKWTGSTDVVTENVVTGWDGGVEPEKQSPFTPEQEDRIRQIVREMAA